MNQDEMKGLSSEEAKQRLAEYGPNQILRPKDQLWGIANEGPSP